MAYPRRRSFARARSARSSARRMTYRRKPTRYSRGSGSYRGVPGNTVHIRSGAATEFPMRAPNGRAMHFYDNLLLDPVPTGQWQPTIQTVPFICNLLDGSTTSGPQCIGWVTPAMVPGDGLSNFQGQSLYLHSVLIRGSLFLPPTTGRGVCSMIVVYDSAPRGVMPTVADIMDTPEVYALQRVDARARFSLLYRKDYSFENGQAYTGTGIAFTASPTTEHNVAVSIPIRRMQTLVQGGGTNIASVTRGSLYLFFVGSGQGVIEGPTTFVSTCAMFRFRTRVLFNDLT